MYRIIKKRLTSNIQIENYGMIFKKRIFKNINLKINLRTLLDIVYPDVS